MPQQQHATPSTRKKKQEYKLAVLEPCAVRSASGTAKTTRYLACVYSWLPQRSSWAIAAHASCTCPPLLCSSCPAAAALPSVHHVCCSTAAACVPPTCLPAAAWQLSRRSRPPCPRQHLPPCQPGYHRPAACPASACSRLSRQLAAPPPTTARAYSSWLPHRQERQAPTAGCPCSWRTQTPRRPPAPPPRCTGSAGWTCCGPQTRTG